MNVIGGQVGLPCLRVQVYCFINQELVFWPSGVISSAF